MIPSVAHIRSNSLLVLNPVLIRKTACRGCGRYDYKSWPGPPAAVTIAARPGIRRFNHSARYLDNGKELRGDPRTKGLGKEIVDEYVRIREHYDCPKYPIVLAHGLLGFDELKLAGRFLPTIHYWHGIRAALTAQGVEVITAAVPPSGSIQQRAAALGTHIAAQARGRTVTVVAHSMGGLDARYMISQLRPAGVDVRALVTVSTPHRGSTVADAIISGIGPRHLPRLYRLWERTTGLGSAAFTQLTTRYMCEQFNPQTPDAPNVRYFSYGAAFARRPRLLSVFRWSHAILEQAEGPNDGLVSVESSKWGTCKGTLMDVSHLDLINWSNRLRYTVNRWMGNPEMFNAIAFYLAIADMLAKEDL